MIKNCGCKTNEHGSAVGAEWQDAQYGKGNREHNLYKDKGGNLKERCTVCGKISGASSSKKEEEKKKPKAK